MNVLALIEAKRDGQHLAPDQIRELIKACTDGSAPDYQLAAFLMAVYFRGLNPEETTALTLAMRDSGDVLKFPKDERPLVDKHSTGGVGDKVSLPLAPLLACLGFRVPMISGRGLGITGGTLDKLDSIPGFKTSLSTGEILEIVQRVGCVICGQTDRMAPADKHLYALRDVTGTVPSIPLIVASILSKKLAESLDALVLDVKFGAAAFMPELDKARELARAMVALGNDCGTRTHALITRMDAPLGRAAGNWLEVKESVSCLQGERGPAGSRAEDLRELVLACASRLLVMTGKTGDIESGMRKSKECLDSGEPLGKWEQMVEAQGADGAAFRARLEKDSIAAVVREVISPRRGFITHSNARVIGEVVRNLGGGRLHKDSKLDYAAGVDRIAKPGEEVREGSLLCRLHASDETSATKAVEQLQTAFVISDVAPAKAGLIVETIE